MGMVAILVMWPWGFVQIFIPSALGGSKRNLVTFGQVEYRRSLRLKIFLFLAWVAILFIGAERF